MAKEFPHFLALSASAGSGKTFALAARYVALLFLDESPSSILAATFTNKAAAEMRLRVIRSLQKMDDKDFIKFVSEQTGFSQKELIARQPQVLARFLASPNHIVTLDSFFGSILRSSSLEIGLEPTFITRESNPDATLDRFLGEAQHAGLLQSLAQLAHQIEDKRFAKILGLLHHFYTVDPLLPPRPAQTHDTLKEAEVRIESLRVAMLTELERAGATKSALGQFQTSSTQELFAKKLWEKTSLGEHIWYKKRITPEQEDLFDQLKSALNGWIQIRESHVLKHLFDLYDHYRNALIDQAKSSGILSFDDLSYFTYRLLHESISREFLYFKIDARFHHILLDEFQDTSTLQFLLLKPLIDEIFAGKGQSELRSFFYVGDTKQSLYRFRGGVEELFDRVAILYGITIQPMDTNYRSSRHVIEQVNRWFENTMPGYTPQNPRNGAQYGYVEVLEVTGEENLVERAIKQAHRLHEAGVNWDAIAFLVHTNNDGQALQQTCATADIPTRLKTSSSLRNHPKIAALVAMVEYLYRGYPIDAEAMLQRVGITLSEAQIEGYTAFMSPLQMVDKLTRDFGYFDDDPNVLRLLEFAAGFDDIVTFLEEFAASSIAVAAHTVHGAQIMTIHGSKGLEFDHVILLDRLTRPRPDTSPLLFNYRNDLHIGRILYRTKGRENLDPDYAATLERQKEAAAKDRLNLLYVALTRAAEGLTIIRKPKESIFDTIGIEPMKLGGSTSLVTEPHRSTPTDPLTGSGTRSVPEPVKGQTITLTNYGYQEKPTPEEDEERDHEAILFGTALHYALEMLPAFTHTAIPAALTTTRNHYGHLLRPEQLSDIHTRIAHLIEHTEFSALLKGATLRREQSIAYHGEFKQIDLLLEYPDRAVVIDYKSSQKYAGYHRAQVRHYVEAVGKILGKPTKGKIVYMLKGKVEIKNT
jgi:exodeoxyribonuclease V beta subunit